jgi:arginine repressor
MARPKKDIPLHDIKGLKTLLKEGKTQQEIADYYTEKGIDVDQATISRRIKEMTKLDTDLP